jgi:hypothetical protein
MKARERKVKKRMPRDARPVLTSPWKIGMFVSLLLMFVGLGVGCYLVIFYNVNLEWIKTGSGGWGIDSELFFKETYPLVAGLTLISLFTYFIIASAVRRYKFYLDSGQDYRKMIALAESIDDLTNPAQIVRLSSYPELQAVLRNYGDQIREISRDLGQKEGAADLEELESQINEILGATDSVEEALEGKARPSICQKVKNAIESGRARIGDLEKRGEIERRMCGRAALAYGRILEAISGAGEELLAITGFAGELAIAASTLSGEAAATKDQGSQEKILRAIVLDMEGSVRKLEDGGHVLHEFSEENNGIAINLALMASRGHVNEHDLATFAERVRSTAERFHKLSGTVSSIAQGLLGSCYALKDKMGDSAPTGQGVDADALHAIVGIARRLEERCANLQKQICNLGSELHDVHELLQNDTLGALSPATSACHDARKEAADLGVAPAADASSAYTIERSGDSSELVIDRGKSWSGVSAEAPEEEKAERAEEVFSFKHMSEEKERPSSAAVESPGDERKSDYSDMSSLRELDRPGGAETESAPRSEQPHDSTSWMEMPGHRWLKINVEKSDFEEEAGNVKVAVKSPKQAVLPDAGAAEPKQGVGVFEHVGEPPLKAEAGVGDDPIYDLFDLGAVEYVEDVPARK